MGYISNTLLAVGEKKNSIFTAAFASFDLSEKKWHPRLFKQIRSKA